MTGIWDDLKISALREWVLLRRHSSHLVNGCCFLMLVGLVLQVMLGPMELSATIAVTLIWILILLSILLIAEGWLTMDYKSGYYEIWVSQGRSLWLAFIVKILSQWFVISLLLSVLSPILAMQLGVSLEVYPFLIAALILSCLSMISLCALGAVVTLGQSSGLLMAILVLPLNIPPMVFGAGAIIEQLEGGQSMPVFLLLGALALAGVTLVPPLMSYCLRVMMD